jgi:hypothetical protein
MILFFDVGDFSFSGKLLRESHNSLNNNLRERSKGTQVAPGEPKLKNDN